MKIYENKHLKYKKLKHLLFSNKKLNKLHFIVVVLISFLVGFLFSAKIKSSNSYKKTKKFAKEAISGNLHSVKEIVKNSNIKIIKNDGFDIDIKFKNWKKIKYLREKALLGSFIPASSQEKVPAKIRYKGKTYKVQISLTGGVIDHLINPLQWSLAVKVKGKKTIMGMKKFAILIPDARGYLTDWIAHKMLKNRGVIGLRSNYIDVNINGDYHGVYYIEERFDKRLIESNGLREGIVFKINLAIPKSYIRKVRDTLNSDLNFRTELVPYSQKRIAENVELQEQLINLKKLWAAFNSNSIPVEVVFDMRKMAALFAITDLLNEKHGMSIHNTRFYYNSITGLIEPIAREWMLINESKKFGTLYLEGEVFDENYYDNHYLRSEIYEKLYKNKEFKELYIQEANIVSSFAFFDSIITKSKEEISYLVSKIHQSNPNYEFPIKTLQKHQELMRNKLYPSSTSIKVFFDKIAKRKINLLVENLTNLPHEINLIKYNNIIIYDKRFFIAAKQDVKNKLQKFTLEIPDSINFSQINIDSLSIFYNVYGLKNVTSNYLSKNVYSKTVVYPKVMSLDDYSNLSLPNRMPNIKDFNFLKVDTKKKTIEFLGENIIIEKDLILPKNYYVFIKEGQKIDIVNNARIISHATLKFFGKKNNPIEIFSSDKTGQGIVVYSAKDWSELKYVNFRNLSNISSKGWNLRGAITFYESPVYINNCVFDSNLKGDDYLNIVRTSFKVEGTVFKNTFADAFDADFSKGSIKNTKFLNIGNDAVDVSGTTLQLVNIDINGVGDKGISGGEDSELICNNLSISNSEIAVASKDKTVIKINKILISNSKLGYCSFQKKPEYDVADIIVTNAVFNNVKTKYLIEVKSSLTLNGRVISDKSNKVKQYLYGKEYGKSSK